MGEYSSYVAQLTVDHIKKMVHDNAQEGSEFDFKKTLDLTAPESKRDHMLDVTAFANAEGGTIIVGVKEQEGHPGHAGSWVDLSEKDATKLKQQITSLCGDYIDPSIRGLNVRTERISEAVSIVVVSIPVDGCAHAVIKLSKTPEFFKRVGDTKVAMTVAEVQTAFSRGQVPGGASTVYVSKAQNDAHTPIRGYVYCFLIDVMRSTMQMDRRSSAAVDRFDAAFGNYLDSLLEPLGLSLIRQDSTGDGVKLLTDNVNDLQALCCLGVIMSRRLRSQLAQTAVVPIDSVPPLRISICSGKDTKTKWGFTGSSSARAAEANIYCVENEVLVDEVVRNYVCDDFKLELVDLNRRPAAVKPGPLEDVDRLYALKDLRLENLPESDLLPMYSFALLETGRESKAHELLTELEDRLNQETQRLSDKSSETQRIVTRRWNRLLNSQTDYEQAERVYDRMVSNGIEPNVVAYTVLMNKSVTYTEARAWLSRMVSAGIKPNVVSYSTLMKKASEYEAAADCYKEMLEAGVHPNEVTYGCLLAKSPDYETATAWMEQISISGLRPTQYQYTAMVMKSPDYATAVQWVEKMKEQGIAMTTWAYSAMMHKSKDFETAVAWYTSMRHSHIKPDVFTLNNLLEKAPDYTTALEWLTKLVGRNVVPDVVTYNTMIKQSPDCQEAYSWYEKALASGLHLTKYTLVALIHHSPDSDEALGWVDKFVANGTVIDTKVYQTLLYCASTAESIDRIRRKARSLGFRFDVGCFNRILEKAHTACEVQKVMRDMRLSRIQPDELTYQVLFGLPTDYEFAMQVLDSVTGEHVTIAPEAGVHVLRCASDYRQGLDLLERLRGLGMAITEAIWNALFQLDLSGVPAQEVLDMYVKQPMRPRRAMESAISNYRGQQRWDDCFFLVMNYPFLPISLSIMRKRSVPSCEYFRTFLADSKQGHNAAYALGLALHETGQDAQAIEYLRIARDGAGLGARRESLDELIESISLKA